jgi:sialate O-acetylesterase
MIIDGSNTITIHDVVVGEVWIGSGQSNMVMQVSLSLNAEKEIAGANYPLIRLFTVKNRESDQPLDDVEGQWKVCSPTSVRDFSAVGYYFAREIYRTRHVPVGLICSSSGGTPAQAWTSRAALVADPSLKYVLDEWDKVLADYPAAQEKYEKDLAAWKPDSGMRKPQRPRGPGHHHTPGGLYNGMIAPLTPFGIRGVIWYQGESNTNELHAFRYRRLFRAMIEDWRRSWGEGDFPFLFVQLANFQTDLWLPVLREALFSPSPDFKAAPWWPVLRESQSDALELRKTGMVVAIDVGESADIHPKNKQEVGRRLAISARHIAYGEPMEFTGPVLRQLIEQDGKLRIWLDHAHGLKAKDGGPLTGFTIAGRDGKYVNADARIIGETVVVSSPQVPHPISVRYAWADDPSCNLVNGDGLPAAPFRAGEFSQ